MSENVTDLKVVSTRVKRLTRYALYAVILLPVVAVVVAYAIWRAQPQAQNQSAKQIPSTVISAATLEDRFGVRITRIAVTAGGGIIDVRYKVLDKDKAEYLLNDPENPLYLVVEGSNVVLSQPGHAMKHNSQLKNNSSHYSFYPNTQNVVQRGTPVSVAFGSLRMEPMVVQ